LKVGIETNNTMILSSSAGSNIVISGNFTVSSGSKAIYSGNIVIPNGGGTHLSGNGIAIGIDVPYESIHVVNGNVRIEGSGTDLSYIVKNYGLPLYPQFRMGSIIAGGDGDPEIRWIYSDLSQSERSVFEFDKKGIVASVKIGYGSHFEGFISGEVNPLFRLNSSPSMSLELGSGSNNWTDVILRRYDQGRLKILSQLSGGTAVTGSLDVANIYSSDGHLHLSSTFGTVAVSGNLKVLGVISGGVVNTLNSFSGNITISAGSNIVITSGSGVITIASTNTSTGSVTSVNGLSGTMSILAGPNITITSGTGFIMITGSAGGGGGVTGSDNFFVNQILQVSGSIINPVGPLIFSSTLGSAVAFSASLDFTNTDKPYHVKATNSHLIFSSSVGSTTAISGNVKVQGQLYNQDLFTVSTTGSVVTVNFNSGSSWIVNLSGAASDVTASLTNMQPGSSYVIKALQGPVYRNLLFSGTGAGISGSRFPNSGSIPTMTSGNLAEDIYTIWFDGKRPYITYLQNWL
jgi:hypothetical protein